MNRDAVSNRLTHCSAFAALPSGGQISRKTLDDTPPEQEHHSAAQHHPGPAVHKAQKPAVGRNIQRHNGNERQRRKKDSTIARITGAMGPRPPKPSSRAFQNSSVPSWWSQPIIVISIPRVPSLSFFFSISGFYDTPVNKIRAFLSYHLYYETAGAFPAQGGDLYAFPAASAAAFSARACIRSICWARIRSQRASPASSGIWTQRAKLQCRPSRRASL